MSDEKALLAAIGDNPDEDTPRLVYADWLDEHAASDAQRGRAEFIRVQIEAARLNAASQRDAERQKRLEARDRSLLRRYKKAWLEEFADVPAVKPSFGRGFVSMVEYAAAKCVGTPQPRWHREPFARVTLRGDAADVRALCAGWLDGVRDLDIELKAAADADAVAETVAQSGCAATLQTLLFWSEGLSDRALAALAAAAFPGLGKLSLRGQFTPDGWAEVLTAPAAAGVTDLTIGHRAPWQTAGTNRPGPALADAITAAPLHARLESLWMGECGLGADGLTRLARGRFDRLGQLQLDNERLDVTAARAFGGGFPALNDLRISQFELTDDVFAALVGSPLMDRLEYLDLSLNDLTAAGAKALARCGRTAKLKYLDIGFNEIGDAGAAALAKAPLPALEELHLCGAHLTDKGADAVARAPWAGQLKTLYLSYNNEISPGKAEELTEQFGPVLSIYTD